MKHLTYLNTSIRVSILAISALLLSGCDKGPSETDIKAAYQTEIDAASAITQKYTQAAMPIVLNKVTKQKCTVVDSKRKFRCQVVLDVTMPIAGQSVTPSTFDLRPVGDKWVIDRSQE